MKKRATLVRVDGRNHEDVIEYAVMHDNGTELGLVRLDSAADEWVAVLSGAETVVGRFARCLDAVNALVDR